MNKVFALRPSGKDYLWGGNRLNELFGKGIDMKPLAETWECSTHPAGPSYIVGGEFDGMTLAQVLELHPEFLGSHPQTAIPILIKFIDAQGDLSVQVHPSDEYAREYENGQMGKTEMWYVMDAEPGASLVYGLKSDISAEQLRSSIADNTLSEHLNSVPVRKGDVFFIEAGTIHAIGAGALIAEIQQNSNLTYRLYDYGRRDKDGKLRELHIDKAIAVSKLNKAGDHRLARPCIQEAGLMREQLCSCAYFSVEKLTLSKGAAPYRVGSDSFRVLLCLEGEGSISEDKAGFDAMHFKAGDCLFIPAAEDTFYLHGKTVMLSVVC